MRTSKSQYSMYNRPTSAFNQDTRTSTRLNYYSDQYWTHELKGLLRDWTEMLYQEDTTCPQPSSPLMGWLRPPTICQLPTAMQCYKETPVSSFAHQSRHQPISGTSQVCSSLLDKLAKTGCVTKRLCWFDMKQYVWMIEWWWLIEWRRRFELLQFLLTPNRGLLEKLDAVPKDMPPLRPRTEFGIDKSIERRL